MTINFDLDSGSMGPVGFICMLAVCIIMIMATWKVFVKAGEHGWAIFVPFYGNFCEFRIAFGNGWLFLLMFVPLVNFVVSIMLVFKLAKAFGRGTGFGFGLLFLPFIFLPILGFGNDEYEGA